MQVKSTGNIDCVALGKNLSSLIFTETEESFGVEDLGLTCWTYDENNRWNSSDPEQNAQATGPSSTGSASNPTESSS